MERGLDDEPDPQRDAGGERADQPLAAERSRERADRERREQRTVPDLAEAEALLGQQHEDREEPLH